MWMASGACGGLQSWVAAEQRSHSVMLELGSAFVCLTREERSGASRANIS